MAKRTAKNSVFLDLREKEVVTIMMSLFDEKQIIKSFIKSERYDEAKETAERMIRKGKMLLEEIADYVPNKENTKKDCT